MAAFEEGVSPEVPPELPDALSPACTLEVLLEQDASTVKKKKAEVRSFIPRIFEHPYFESAVRRRNRIATEMPLFRSSSI